MFHEVGCQVISVLQDEDNRKGADVHHFLDAREAADSVVMGLELLLRHVYS